MGQPSVHLGRKRANSSAREMINRAARRNEQATEIIHNNLVSTGKSPQVPEANVPRCSTRSIVPGTRLRVLRVSAKDARTQTSVGNNRLKGISQSNAREPISRAVRQNDQATGLIHNNTVSTGKSSQVPEANVVRCATRSVVPGAGLRVLRVSTADARTKTSVGNTRLQGIGQSKDANDNIDMAFDKKADLCTRTTSSKEMKKAGCSCSAGINRDSRKSAKSGVSGVNRRRAVTVLGSTNKFTTKDLLRAAEKCEFETKAPEPHRRLQGANGKGVGTKQQEHGISVPLSYRAPSGSCVRVHTRGNEQKTGDLMSTKPVKSKGTSEARIPLRPPASVGENGVKSQIPHLSLNVTSAAFRGSGGRTDGRQQPENGLHSLPQQSESFRRSVCRPPLQRASDFSLTTNPSSLDVSVEHRNCLTLNSVEAATFTSKHCSTFGDDTVTDVSDVQPPSVDVLAPYKLSSARIGIPAKGAWSASKPFPKREAVVLSTSDVRLCSPLSRRRTPTPPGNRNQEEARVTSDADSGFLPARHSMGVSNYLPVAEEVCEQQQRSAADTTKLAPAKGKLRPLPEQTVQQGKVRLQVRGAPVLRTAARALARAVVSGASAVPTVPACAARNEGLFMGRRVHISKVTAGPVRVPSASASQTNPNQQTGSQGKDKPARCLLRSKMETLSFPEKPAVAKCVTLQQCRDLKAKTKSYTVSQAVKQKASANDASPPQLQPQLLKAALLAKDPASVSSAQKKGLPSVALGGPAAVLTRTRLVLPVCRSGESKQPLVRLETTNAKEDVRTSTRKAVAPNARLQKLRLGATLGASSPTEPRTGLEVSYTPYAAECDPELLPLRPIPAERPRKRPPQVPSLPLHLLPEILARKDAEEEAMRWEEGCPFDEDEGEKFDFRVATPQQRSSCRQLDNELEDFAFKSSLEEQRSSCRQLGNELEDFAFKSSQEELKSNSERRSAEHLAPFSNSGLPSLQLQSLAGTCGDASVVEEGNGASLSAASSRSVGASAVISRDVLRCGKKIFSLSVSTGYQISPRLHAQNKCDTEFFRTSEQEFSILPLEAAQSHGLIKLDCRVFEKGTPTAVSSECDAHRGDLQQSIRHETPEILAGVPRLLEADQAGTVQGSVHCLDACISRLDTAAFDTLNSSVRDIGGLPQKSLEDGMPSKASSLIRNWNEAEQVTERSSYQLAGQRCKETLEPSHQDLLEAFQQVIPETEAQQKTLDMSSEPDPKWKLHRCSLDSPDEILSETSQWTDSCYLVQESRKEQACAYAGPGLQRPQCHASSRTLSRTEEQSQHTSQPPSLKTCSHIRAGHAVKRGNCQPCSSYVRTLTHANRLQQRTQRTTADTQSQKERSSVQRKIQQKPRTAFRDASVLQKNAGGSDKPHTLSGLRQPAETPVTLNMKKKENATLPRTYAPTQKENAAQLLRCTRKAAGRSVLKHDEQSAVPEPGINARQSSIQPRDNARLLQPDLGRRPSNSIVKPSPAKENDFSCTRQLVLPRENRPLGVPQQRNLRYPPRQPVRPRVLHSPLTLYSTECKSEQRNEGPHISGALVQEHSTKERVSGSKPEPSVHTLPKCTKATGNTPCQFSVDISKPTVKSWSTCAAAQVARPSHGPGHLQRDSGKCSAQTRAGLPGSRCAVSKVSSQTNQQDLSRTSNAAPCSSLRNHVNQSTVSDGPCCPGAAPAVDACGQRWRAQQRLGCRPCLPAAEGVLDAFCQLGTSSHEVQLQYTTPPFTRALVDSCEEKQVLPSCSDQGRRYTLEESCDSCPAARQPLFTEKQFYQCTPPSSIAPSQAAFEQPAIHPMTLGRQNAMHPVIPLHTSSSTVQPLPQQLMHMRSAARVKPSPAVARCPGKPLTDSMLHCASGDCHAEAPTPEPHKFLSATRTYAIKPPNSQYSEVFSQAATSRLCSPRGCVFLRQSTLTAHRGVLHHTRVPLNAHVAVGPQQTPPHKLCHARVPSVSSCPDRTLRIPSSQQVFPDRFDPLTVICTH